MYTLWTLIEVLTAAGALDGAEGVERELKRTLELDKQISNTFFYQVDPPYVEMDGYIERLRLVMHRTGALIRVDIDLSDGCITKERIKKYFPDLYFNYQAPSAAPGATFSFASRSLEVPVLFIFRNQSPDCLSGITIDYQSRVDEYGIPPPERSDD